MMVIDADGHVSYATTHSLIPCRRVLAWHSEAGHEIPGTKYLYA